jgi:DNA-binding IclR family transcriptional regulator
MMQNRKVSELLKILAEMDRPWSVSALARAAGVSRYRAERLLVSLERQGTVRYLPHTGRYHVLDREFLAGAARGEAPGRAGASHANREESALCQALLQGARPVMESLAERHQEAMYLTVLNGHEVLFLDMAGSHYEPSTEPLVGKRFPFFCNAAGKVMRAIDSWDLLEQICKRRRGPKAGQHELERLQAELEQIREKGVAVDYEGMGEGIITVAVAVRDYAGKVIAALTLLGPSVRLLGARLEEEIIPSLRSSGELLSTKFGYARQ